MRAVQLLKHGQDTRYFVCDCCGHYAQGLSARGWCPSCEFECTHIGKLVREKLNRMRVTVLPEPVPTEPAGSTEPRSSQSAPGELSGRPGSVPSAIQSQDSCA